MKRPASFWSAGWRDALPSGNGQVGAAVYGGIFRERILITHEDLWNGNRSQPLPDVSHVLSRTRQLLLEGRPQEAEPLISEALRERGYDPRAAAPLPLADLLIEMSAERAFKNYQRSLNMETGEVSVAWDDGDTRFERVLFVSRPDNLIVLEIRKRGPALIRAVFSIDLHDRSDVRQPFNGLDAKLPEGLEQQAHWPHLFYAARNDDGTDFGAVGRVICDGGIVKSEANNLCIEGAHRVLVCVRPFVKGVRETDWKRLVSELAKVPGLDDDLLTEKIYTDLQDRHVAEHRPLFTAVTFDLNAADRGSSNEQLLSDAYCGEAPLALVERMWAYGRYLLLSSSRPGGHPCPLHGLWLGEYSGFWSFNMANENLQMIYWQALSGNMCDTMLAVFDYYERHLADFRENAKKLYGCRGIFIAAVTTPLTGLVQDIQPHILHWTGAAGWIAQLYYDYYLYTGDVAFLRQRALPFMREVAEFYSDFLISDDDGRLMSLPSNSPENSPGNYWRGEHLPSISTTINATMDFAIAKEVYTNLIEGSTVAGLYAERIPAWTDFLKKIPSYEINEDGAVKEWMHPSYTDNYHHRHQSHIYPVFPGTEIIKEEQPELFQSFVAAVKKRLVIGLKEQSGWSLAHMANNYARMGEGDLALECLDILSRSCLFNNLYTSHNDWRDMGIGVDLPWAPFQIDANMGWTAAVQEMLLFSKPGMVKLLPALPTRWRTGSVSGLLCRGGITVSIRWDADSGALLATLCSRSNQEITLKLPFEPVNLNVSGASVRESLLGPSFRRVRLTANVDSKLELSFNYPEREQASSAN